MNRTTAGQEAFSCPTATTFTDFYHFYRRFRMNITTKTLTALTGLALFVSSADAGVITLGTPDFSLSSSTASGTTHDNLPTSFASQVVPGDITSTTTSNNGSFPESRLTDGNLAHSSGSWASGSASTVTITLAFSDTDVSGLILNWAWSDRTPGDYEIRVDGTSLGSIQVDNAGENINSKGNVLESLEPNTYIIFDTAQTVTSKIEIIASNGGPVGSEDLFGFDEIEVYTVPEPGSLALLGLGGLLIARRRRG